MATPNLAGIIPPTTRARLEAAGIDLTVYPYFRSSFPPPLSRRRG